MKDFLNYLPVLIAILAAILGYVSGQRGNKINRFYSQVETNLKEVCGPLYFLLDEIQNVEDSDERESKLDYLFINYVSEKNKLFMLGNRYIIEYILRAERKYKRFKKTRKQEDWEIFWQEFAPIRIMIENQYWNNFQISYGEYKWFQKTLVSNIFVRIWYELLFFLFQAGQAIINVMAIFTTYTIYDYYVIHQFPKGTVLDSFIILLVLIGIYGFLLIIGPDIKVLRNKDNKSKFRIIFEKILPKPFEKWDQFINAKKEDNIPDMHYQTNKDEDSDR